MDFTQIDEEIKRTREAIKSHEEKLKLAKHLEKLRTNEDFIAVIEKDYCTKYLKTLVRRQESGEDASASRGITGVGQLQKFFDIIENSVVPNEYAILEHENTLKELEQAKVYGEMYE